MFEPTRLRSLKRLCAPALACAIWLCHCNLPRHSAAQAADLTAIETDSDSPGVVNLNTATAEELERLPGIGPARARAILALRASLTRFLRLEQLLRVKGIGRATFRKLRPMLTLSGPTTLR